MLVRLASILVAGSMFGPVAFGVTVGEVPGLVRRQNHDVLAAEKDVDAARSARRAAWGPVYPKVELKSSFTRLNDDIQIDIPSQRIERDIGPLHLGIDVDPPPVKVQDRDIRNAHLLATQPLYTGGRISAGLDAAQAQIQDAELALATTVEAKTVEALTRYFQAVLATRVTVVLRSVAAELDRMEQVATSLVTNGVAAKFSTLQISVAKADLKARLAEAESKVKLADLAFKASAGMEMTQPVVYASDLKQVPLSLGLDVFKTQALSRRREFAQLDAKAAQISALRQAKTGEMLPTVYLFGKRELIKEDLTQLQPLWAVGIGMDIPLTAGITQIPERQRAAELGEKVEALRAKARHEIPLQVESLHVGATSLAGQIQALDAGLGMAQEALRLAEIRFKSGAGSSLEVLKAQTDFETMQVKRLVLLEDYNRRLLELYQAAGATADYVAAYDAAGKAGT